MAGDADRTSSPRVSVIMNVWNGARFLREAVDSVLAQSFADWELLVYDDCSDDDSAAIAGNVRDPRIRCVTAPFRAPLGRVRQDALRLTRAPWIAWIDQDDVWLPHKLAAQMRIVDEDGGGDLGIVYGRALPFGPDGRAVDVSNRFEFDALPEGRIHVPLLAHGDFIAMSTSMVRREAFDTAGGIPEGVDVAVDYWLFTAISRDWRARALQDPCCRYRVHAGGMMRTLGFRAYAEALRVVEEFGGALEPGLLDRRRRVWHSLMAVEEIRGGRLLAGVRRLLSRGSAAYVLTRPAARALRALRRARLRRRGPQSPGQPDVRPWSPFRSTP